jgi:hypothetical protein
MTAPSQFSLVLRKVDAVLPLMPGRFLSADVSKAAGIPDMAIYKLCISRALECLGCAQVRDRSGRWWIKK